MISERALTNQLLPVMLAAVVMIPQSTVAVRAEPRLESNVIYGMYSGLALLTDIFHPEQPNGYGIIFVSGSGWHDPTGHDARPLKERGQEQAYAVPLAEAGYTVFVLNHRAAPRFRYPAAVEDVQRAVRFIRHSAGRFGIRADRIGAMGGSSGGHLVSLLGTLDGTGDPENPDPVNRESAKVQCVVARAAPSDMSAMAGSDGALTFTPKLGHLKLGFRGFRNPLGRTVSSAPRNSSLLVVDSLTRTFQPFASNSYQVSAAGWNGCQGRGRRPRPQGRLDHRCALPYSGTGVRREGQLSMSSVVAAEIPPVPFHPKLRAAGLRCNHSASDAASRWHRLGKRIHSHPNTRLASGR